MNNLIYNGSKICVLSSNLFLIASLFNFIWSNYIECSLIFLLFMTSVSYHKNPSPLYKIIDEFMVKFTIFICVVLSLYNCNILPTISTILIFYTYYNRPNCHMSCTSCNLYHAIFVHFIGFLGFMSIFYNKNKIF